MNKQKDLANIKEITAGTLKVGDKILPQFYGKSEKCSPVTVDSIEPYGNSHHSIIVDGYWMYCGTKYRSWENGGFGLVYIKTEKIKIVG